MPILVIGLFALSFSFTSNDVSIQEIEISQFSEQDRINAELSDRGMLLVNDVWYSPDHFKLQDMIEKYKIEAAQNGLSFNAPLVLGGIITAAHYDADRNLISIQNVHNRVVDEGEDFLIEQLFKEGTAGEGADADQLATICVSARVGFVDTSEAATASDFDTNDNLGVVDNCIADAAVSVASQIATIGALTFDAPTHVPATTVITGIAICQGETANPTPFNLCVEAQAASSGIMFSIINIADVTLQTSETVDITYNLDVSSAGS